MDLREKESLMKKIDRKKIKEIRELAFLSRKQFAERIGVSVRTVEAYEQGARSPGKSAEMLIRKIQKETE